MQQHVLTRGIDGVFRVSGKDATIFSVIMDAISFAEQMDSSIEFEFNGIDIEIEGGDDPYFIYYEFTQRLCSVETNRHKKDAYQRGLIHLGGILNSIEAVDIQLEGAPAFSVVDTEAWRVFRRKSKRDFFGNLTLSFAERWARLMQIGIAEGERLEDIVEATLIQAVRDHISDENYGHAMDMLFEHWKYGDRLRVVL